MNELTREPGQDAPIPRLYGELAPWFHLLTAPAEYAEEADLFRRLLLEHSGQPPRTVLELGSGGGNNASHLKAHFTLTLVDLSPAMLELSRGLNPECEHLVGDMRSVRLGREFDAVFVHDAIMYATTEVDLRRTVETAFLHCRPGSVALFAPDCVSETFSPETDHGGHDDGSRSLRYLEWSWDPDPSDSTYTVAYSCILREEGGPLRVTLDEQIHGLFPRATWLQVLEESGFTATIVPDQWGRELFVCLKAPG